jgi:hypothetical protein
MDAQVIESPQPMVLESICEEGEEMTDGMIYFHDY